MRQLTLKHNNVIPSKLSYSVSGHTSSLTNSGADDVAGGSELRGPGPSADAVDEALVEGKEVVPAVKAPEGVLATAGSAESLS